MAKGKTYYKLKTNNDAPKARTITKFDSDLDVISSYFMTYIQGSDRGYYDCSCPASKFDCRHKGIMAEIEARGALDSDKFFCFETKELVTAEQI